MTKLTVAHIHDITASLQQRRQELLAIAGPHLHRSEDASSLVLSNPSEDGEGSVAADVLNDTDIAQLGLELAELGEIDAALVRVDAGTFGICTACGEPIPEARLRAMPAARFCIACQESSEKVLGFPHNVSL
ncbi:TraR/DksA family transcriptional regulator [Actimicrobium antarcticum]|uniref:Zinc finger DksA/TraR C4-type domain-containing protein n=1 Tax=Actimicrobium antarcticum TaxID=1051899 RepID=A0ABP7TL61_9BURK